MTDEFNIVEEKTPEEKKIEKIGREIEHMMDAERLKQLVKMEFSDIDLITGVLLQTRGLIQMDRTIAADIEDYLEDMLIIAKEMIRCMNKPSTTKKKVKKDE